MTDPDSDPSNHAQDGEPFLRIVLRYIPKHAWLFAAACLLVPIAAAVLNATFIPIVASISSQAIAAGRIPDIIGALGAVGAGACLLTSLGSLPTNLHLYLCVLITAGAWAVLLFVFYINALVPFDNIGQL